MEQASWNYAKLHFMKGGMLFVGDKLLVLCLHRSPHIFYVLQNAPNT